MIKETRFSIGDTIIPVEESDREKIGSQEVIISKIFNCSVGDEGVLLQCTGQTGWDIVKTLKWQVKD